MVVRFVRDWRQWKAGAIVSGLAPGVAAELVKRGTAETYRPEKRKRQRDADDRN